MPWEAMTPADWAVLGPAWGVLVYVALKGLETVLGWLAKRRQASVDELDHEKRHMETREARLVQDYEQCIRARVKAEQDRNEMASQLAKANARIFVLESQIEHYQRKLVRLEGDTDGS